MIKLSQILAFTLRTVYSTKRSKVLLGYVGKGWEQRVITALESALSSWLDAVPDHLQWGSEASKRDHVFLFQSTYLRCQFHEMQFHVRRAFAFRDPPDPELSEPSLVVCKDAAKKCIAIVDSAKDVLHTSLYCLGLMRPIFASTTLLTISCWKAGGIENDSPEHHAIEKGINLIDFASERCRALVCLRNLLKVIRGLADGSSGGWVPRVEDLYRLQIEAVIYIDKDGFASPPTGPRSRTGMKIVDPLAQATVSATEPGHEGLGNERDCTGDVKPTLLKGFSPVDLLARSTGLAFGTPAEPLTEEGLDQLTGTNGNDEPSALPIELTMYNDLMMDFGGSVTFFERDWLNSVLFGPLAMEDPGSARGMEAQLPASLE